MRRCKDYEILINAIYLRRAIWDQKSKLYCNRDLKEESWNEVAQIMKQSKDTVKTRWRHLRDSYNRELRKISKSHSEDSIQLLESSWCYFNQMSFLTGNRAEKEVNDSILLNDNGTLYSSTVEAENGQLLQTSTAEPTISIESTFSLNSDLKGRKRNMVRNTDNEWENSSQLEKRNKLETPKEEGEEYHFLMSLLPSLKKLPPQKKLITQIKMQQLIYEAMFEEPSK